MESHRENAGMTTHPIYIFLTKRPNYKVIQNVKTC